MKIRQFLKSHKSAAILIFLGMCLILLTIAFPLFPNFKKVNIANMQQPFLDVDAAVWHRENAPNYILYTYAKQSAILFEGVVYISSHIFCYTIDEEGHKSPEVRISRLRDNTPYDLNMEGYLGINYDPTPPNNGNNFRPKIACSSSGKALLVWEFNCMGKIMILGNFIQIGNDGTISFLIRDEPFVLNTFIRGNASSNCFSSDVVYINSEKFCLLYNEYKPAQNNNEKPQERLVAKLITSENIDPLAWEEPEYGRVVAGGGQAIPSIDKLYYSSVSSLWAFSTRYYYIPVNANNRTGSINKSILCNEVPQGICYEIYIVYNNLGIPDDPLATYLIILEPTDDYSGFLHELGDIEPGPGYGVLVEEGGAPDLNTRAQPQLIDRIPQDYKYIGKPLVALDWDGLLGIAFSSKFGSNYRNTVCRELKFWDTQGNPRETNNQHEFRKIYDQVFRESNILTDIKSDVPERFVLLKRTKPPSLSFLNPNNRYTYYDLIDLKGVIISSEDDTSKEFYISTGDPGTIYGGETIVIPEGQWSSKYAYWTRINPKIEGGRDGFVRLAGVLRESASICTRIFATYLFIYDFFTNNPATVNLNCRVNNDTANFSWSLQNVDERSDFIIPLYTLYLFKHDGVVKVIEKTRNRNVSWRNQSNNDYICKAYLVVDFLINFAEGLEPEDSGISLKSNIVDFAVNRFQPPISLTRMGGVSANASSVYIDPSFVNSYSAQNAIDGNLRTEWAANQRMLPWIQINFPRPVNIRTIKLYDRADANNNIRGGTLTFSNGAPINTGPLNRAGGATVIASVRPNVTWVKLEVTASEGPNPGLSEFEVFEN